MPAKSIYADVRRSTRIRQGDTVVSQVDGGAPDPSGPRASRRSTAGKARPSSFHAPRFDPYRDRRADRCDSASIQRRLFVPSNIAAGEPAPRSPLRAVSTGKPSVPSPLANEYRPFSDDDRAIAHKEDALDRVTEEGDETAVKGPTASNRHERAEKIGFNANSASAAASAVPAIPTAPYPQPSPVSSSTRFDTNPPYSAHPLISAVGLSGPDHARLAGAQSASISATGHFRPEYDPLDPAVGMAEAQWRWRAYGDFKDYVVRPMTGRYSPRAFPDPFW